MLLKILTFYKIQKTRDSPCFAIISILFILGYNGTLDTSMVVSLTATKFMSLIFSVSGFTLSYVANMVILLVLYDLCLLPVYFCYIIIHMQVWEIDSHVKIAAWWTPWKISDGEENLVFQVLQSQEVGTCLKFPGRTCTSHYCSNESFMDGYFNVSTQILIFELGVASNKCSVTFGFSYFYMHSPCDPFI